MMKLKLPNVDGRSGDPHGFIKDLETGKTVGSIHAKQGKDSEEPSNHPRTPSWRVELFGHKYNGRFETWYECAAFVEGVEAVLNHMVSLSPHVPPKDAA